jgi:hypothetical protein
MMDEAVLQAYARLNAHETLLGVIFAGLLASMDSEQEAVLCDGILTSMKRHYLAPDADITSIGEDRALQMLSDARDLAERFLGKVRHTAGVLRAAELASAKKSLLDGGGLSAE